MKKRENILLDSRQPFMNRVCTAHLLAIGRNTMNIRLRYKIIVTVSIVFVILSGPGCNHRVQYERQQAAIAKVEKLDVGHSNFSDTSQNTEDARRMAILPEETGCIPIARHCNTILNIRVERPPLRMTI